MHWRNNFLLIAGQTRLFWELRTKIRQWAFLGHRRLFGLRRHVRENRIQTSMFLQFIRLTIKPIIFSVLSAVGLLLVDSHLRTFTKRIM